MSAQRPSLFHYGRKELSQDAMICWLLDWANECHAKADNEADRHLHECGQKFARALFAKHDRAGPDEIRTVKIGQQVSSIDVLAWVNEEYAILIEDKTDSGTHGNQLQTYHDRVLKGELKIGKENIKPTREKLFPIFFKTGNMSLRKERKVEEVGHPPYRVFGRRNFLDSMEGYDRLSSHILTDFMRYMEEREKAFESWKCDLPENWSWDSWQGFYRCLEDNLNISDWNYVPNQTGGFLGLWWYFKCHNSGDKVYLQTEYSQTKEEKNRVGRKDLCFQIEVLENADQRDRRGYWHERIMGSRKSIGMDIDKPKRFGSGKHMTVAVLNGDWRVFGDDGRLDLEATVKVLENAQRVVDEAMNG